MINPVEAREASLDTKITLKTQVPVPGKVEVIEGFRTMSDADLEQFIATVAWPWIWLICSSAVLTSPRNSVIRQSRKSR